MLKSPMVAVIAAAALFVGAASQAKANLILDGDFTSPSGGGSFVTYNAGSMGPWTVTGSVDLIGGYWQAPLLTPNGGSVDLDGNNPGTISQTFSAAGQYLLTFWLSGNPDGGNPTKTVDVSVGSGHKSYSYLTGSNSHGSMNYIEESLLFTATGPGLTTLTFASLDDATSPFGPVIGDVSVTATPLPSTWSMLLFGFVGLGFAALRGTRKAAPTAA
jgi:choice-of-anchor C domain-containing protein